jgi:glycosyltransferase involved in cell wall biosynthesis
MKLLIITQKVDINDPVLGFFHHWIMEFAKHFDYVSVICLENGKFNLPKNVEVFSLGKERKAGRIRYVLNFYKYIFKLKSRYDTVFVHMNPEYVVLGGIFWKILGKKIALWYTHRQVNIKLRIAEFFADKIFTVSRETFNLSGKKLKIVGHGIPSEMFEKPKDYKRKDDRFRLINVGRITPIKNLDVLIKAADLLQKDIPDLEVVIVGEPTQKGDDEYFEKLKNMVAKHRLENIVRFVGSIPNDKVKEYYWDSDISVNLCPTGGVDKAVLESMASGLPVFASNRAFESYFGRYEDSLLFKERDAGDLARKIIEFKKRYDIKNVSDFLMNSVEEKANLASLISKIVKEIQ